MKDIALNNISTPVKKNSATWRDFIQMTKPTISLLVAITALPGILLAGDELPSLALVVVVFFGTWLAAASGGALNQFVDADIDKAMKRTSRRPLPTGNISSRVALFYGLGLGVLGTGILYVYTTPLAAVISILANLFYVLFYTAYLKKRTVQNIVIGGAAGAVGPLIGCAAVTGELSMSAWLMFWVVFFWTPPHFWALAIKYKDDYASADVPMLPAVKGYAYTRRSIFLYTLTLPPLFILMYLDGAYSLIGCAISLGLTLYFVWKAFQLYYSRDNSFAMPVFHYSCLYLLLVFVVISVDRLVLLLM